MIGTDRLNAATQAARQTQTLAEIWESDAFTVATLSVAVPGDQDARLIQHAARLTRAFCGGWSRPRALPVPAGFAGGGDVTALSCTSRSACTAVGIYQIRSGRNRFFAVTERRGACGKAVRIAAPVASRNVDFGLPVLSCASAGNCVAGGVYGPGAFVVSEVNGTWGKARKVRSAPAAVSCPAPGECTAALARGYLASERRGTWRKAFPVPGLAALSHGQPTNFGVISCPSPGNCTAAASYFEPDGIARPFVVSERHGIWGTARPVRSRLSGGLTISDSEK